MERIERGNKKARRLLQAEKKEVRIGVSFTRAENFVLREKADCFGLKLSQYIRQVTLSTQVISRLSVEERVIARQLVAMANNLDHLAKACHQQGLLSAMVCFESYRNQLDDLLKKLKP